MAQRDEHRRNRTTQIDQFGRDQEPELLLLARAFNWGSPGFELTNWVQRLLPDGFECPEDETYEELRNALQAWQDKL